MEKPLATDEPAARLSTARPSFPWLRFIIGLIVTALTVWLLARQVQWSELRDALSLVDLRFVGLGLLSIMLVNLVKTWRWQQCFVPRSEQPSAGAAFQALMLGQFVNLVSPIRLGELARVQDLHQTVGMNRPRAIGTIVLEKNLETLILLVTALALLPYIVLPAALQNSALTGGLVGIGLIVGLYLLTFQQAWIVRIVQRLASWLPNSAEKRIVAFATAGLDGLAALQDRRAVFGLCLSSALVGFLYLLAPWFTFKAFGLPYGIVAAGFVHLAGLLSQALPAPPFRIGVIEGAVYVVLEQLGVGDVGLKLGYAILFHAVIVLPQIVLGLPAAWRSDWRWRGQLDSA